MIRGSVLIASNHQVSSDLIDTHAIRVVEISGFNTDGSYVHYNKTLTC